MNRKDIEFLFEEMPVVIFTNKSKPVVDGVYSYEPYRGPGHYDMQQALKEFGLALCRYTENGKVVNFSVLSCPEYGKLQLAKFNTNEQNNET